jgi:hypothetical protein
MTRRHGQVQWLWKTAARLSWRSSAVLLGAALLGGAGEAAAQDTSPSGMVAFFMASACPAGWSLATSVQGRLIVGVTNAQDVGLTLGSALADQTPPTHQHTFKGTATIHHKSISGSGGGGNDQGAKKGTYTTDSIKTAAAPSSLPFVQLVACQKN